MIKNYFTVAIRNLFRNKTFTVINIAGLAAGIAVFILIFEFVAFEWSSNRFHKNFSSLYRMGAADKTGADNYFIAPGFATIIKQKITGIESLTRVTENLGNGVVSYTDEKTGERKALSEENICYADSNFLQVFTFPLVAGNFSLEAPATMAISETMAKKIFGKATVAGKTIKISNQFGNTDYTINAVFKDVPEQSDIKPSILLSLSTLQNAAARNGNDWANPATLDDNFITYYLVLNKGVNYATTSNQITSLMHSVQPSTIGNKIVLQPFNEMHLAPGFSYPYQTYGSLKLVTMLLAVAVLILLIAWVNYINLSTVQAMKRAKETGVRKVMGASRWQLTIQYLTETFLITSLSVGFSFVLVQLLQQLFNTFTGKSLSLQLLNLGWFWAPTILFIFLGSLLSGGYVAFVLSSFKPVIAIRGRQTQTKSGSISLRKGLVVFQFIISIVFIICTIILYQQLNYMKTADLGLNLKQLLIIKGPAIEMANRKEQSVAFKNELAKLSFVRKLTASNDLPGRGYNYSADGITRLNPQKNDEKKSYQIFIADENFFDTYDIKFASGNSFPPTNTAVAAAKKGRVILNEKAVAQLGFEKAENMPGQKIKWGEKEYEVIGVVKDYHHLSLQNAIEPIVFVPSVSSSFYTIQTDASNMPQKIRTLNTLFQKYFSGNPFEYFFADETFNKQYNSEQQLSKAFISAAMVAIFIASLGLFGLAAFTARQRTKEIGIRKVLGASVTNIATTLSLDFVKLVLIAIIIASPLAWWAGNHWLMNFAYRTTVGWWMFALAGIIALLIAVITVSFQAIKAAVANPVKSLRTE
jgi:putative ABC transport system permease protein